MTIRKNKPPPNVATHRPARTPQKSKSSKGSKTSKSVGGAGGSGSAKGSGQVKGGTNAFSVDHVDHADPDQRRGRQQFQNTDGPKAENLQSAAKKAVASDGKLRRADGQGQTKGQVPNGKTKAEGRKEVRQDRVRGEKHESKGTKLNKSEASKKKNSTSAAADDDDDGVQIKAQKLAAANSSKVGGVQTARTNKTQKANEGGGKKDSSGAGGVEGKGKGNGNARVEKKSSGERLEANEKVSIAVESSGLAGAAGVGGTEGVQQTEGASQVDAPTGVNAPEMASLSASVDGGSKGLGRKDGHQPGDQKFSAAIKDVPKGEITDSGVDLSRGSGLEREMTDVARGQLESDVQREMSVDAKETKKSATAGLFDDVADAIAEEGGIDGVLGSSTSRAKAKKKGVSFVRDKNDGTRRGIDQPVEKAVSDMAAVTGHAGVDASDIAQNTTKLKNDGEGDDEGEVEEDEEDGEED